MISLIVGIVMLLIGIMAIISYVKSDFNIEMEFLICIAGFCCAAAIIVPVISLCFGMSIYKQKDMLLEKHIIEIVLSNEVSYDTIKEAEKYNHDVQYGNNYWCRFSIEDRSEYIINIDSYLEQSKQDNDGDN